MSSSTLTPKDMGQASGLSLSSNAPSPSKPTALVILAEGAEEMEVVITVDVLRRGGIHVTLAGFEETPLTTASTTPLPHPVRCSRDVTILPDVTLEAAMTAASSSASFHNGDARTAPSPVASYDVIVLPGGMKGAKALAGSVKVGHILKRQEAESVGEADEDDDGQNGGGGGPRPKKYLAAICAGPLAFLSHGIGRGRRITSHPSVQDQFKAASDTYTYVDDADVVVDGPIITSRGPGTSFAFALAIVRLLQSKKVADSLVEPMMLRPAPKF